VKTIVATVVLAALLGLPDTSSREASAPRSADDRLNQQPDVATLVRQAFEASYNLDYPEALALARKSVTLAPNDPAAHASIASVLWLQLLFNRGAIAIDHYLGSLSSTQFALPKPPPAIEAEFLKEVQTAVSLAEAQLRTRPKDPQALFDLGSAWGLRGSYAASIEGSITSAFTSAKRAFNAHEKVMELAPERTEAQLIVGTYRYAISSLALPTRMLAYIVGFGGGKERGTAMLIAASKKGLSQTEAIFGLALVYSREGRHADAVSQIRELERRAPRNRLLVLEEGAALIRAGNATEADRVLTAGIARLDTDPRPRAPGERALWFYKRGLARLNSNRRSESALDLATAIAAEPVAWVRGRIHVELGKLADLSGQRANALVEYRKAATICGQSNDPACVTEARKLERRPFALQ
jgi:tetratricopeptide (TPR) repeat protein